MSMKQELETWVTALQHYDAHEFEESIEAFTPIADTARILFNCGVIRATLGEHEAAVQYYQRATSHDQYLAVAYFQQGVSSFLIGDFEEALANFNDTLLYLRGNKFIDYHQLGLKYKLHSCEALFNRGLCYIYLQQEAPGLADLNYAAKEKAIPDHDVIDEAIKEKAEGYTVFSIPVGVLFRPNEAKVKNVRARDYLGKARLVAQAPLDHDPSHKRQVSMDSWAKDDRLPENISYAATNLIRTGISSRTRLQSEPPINRNVFPPTPPPEAGERPQQYHAQRKASPDQANARARSQSRSRKPEPLNLGVAAFDRSSSASVPHLPQKQPHQRSPQQVSPQQREQQQQQQQQSSPQQYPQADQRRPKPTRSASERPSDNRVPYVDRRSQDSDRYRSTRERLFGSIEHEGQAAEVAAIQSVPQHKQSNRTVSKGNSMQRSPWQQRPDFIKEEEEELFPIILSSSEIRDDSDARSTYSRMTYRSSRRTTTQLMKIRVKVHLSDDTRYIIIMTTSTLSEIKGQIGKKFSLASAFKMKTQDEEGDMITMADQDDLDIAISACKDAATKEGADMGKMELWIQPVS